MQKYAWADACAARGVFGSVFLPPFALDGRSFVRFTVHWANRGVLTDGLYGTLYDKAGHQWHIAYGIASDLIPLSTTSEHYTDRHFELVMQTPCAAWRKLPGNGAILGTGLCKIAVRARVSVSS